MRANMAIYAHGTLGLGALAASLTWPSGCGGGGAVGCFRPASAMGHKPGCSGRITVPTGTGMWCGWHSPYFCGLGCPERVSAGTQALPARSSMCRMFPWFADAVV